MFVCLHLVRQMLHPVFFLLERSVSKSEQADVVIRIPPNSVASFTEKPLSRGQSDLPMTPARKSDTEDSVSLLPTPLTSARGRSAMGLYTLLFLALSDLIFEGNVRFAFLFQDRLVLQKSLTNCEMTRLVLVQIRNNSSESLPAFV